MAGGLEGKIVSVQRIHGTLLLQADTLRQKHRSG